MVHLRYRAPRSPVTAWLVALASLAGLSWGCVTVKPQERAILADPGMQFDTDRSHARQIRHAIENREGSYGGEAVSGGGCGCN